MKNTSLLFILYCFFQLVVGCNSKSKEKTAIQNSNKKMESVVNDSIVDYYSAQIQKHYVELQVDKPNLSNKIELQLEGKTTFENDSLLILSFDEVVKFGSYRYSKSSLVFKKKNNQLVPIKPLFCLDKKSDGIYEELNYPNRIPGYFTKSIDVTGDGIPEYVFSKRFMFKYSIDEEVKIYKLDHQKHILQQLNLEANSSGSAYSPDTLIGTNERMSFIETNKNEVIVKVVSDTTELNKNKDLVVKDVMKRYYRYAPTKNKFEEMLDQ